MAIIIRAYGRVGQFKILSQRKKSYEKFYLYVSTYDFTLIQNKSPWLPQGTCYTIH